MVLVPLLTSPSSHVTKWQDIISKRVDTDLIDLRIIIDCLCYGQLISESKF